MPHKMFDPPQDIKDDMPWVVYKPVMRESKDFLFDKWVEYHGIEVEFATKRGKNKNELCMRMQLYDMAWPDVLFLDMTGKRKTIGSSTNYQEFRPMRDNVLCKEKLVKIVKKLFVQDLHRNKYEHLILKGKEIGIPWTAKEYKVILAQGRQLKAPNKDSAELCIEVELE